MVSLQHAKYMQDLGHEVAYTSINPASIDQPYSVQYSTIKQQEPGINFIELNQSTSALGVYAIQPGETRDRWNVESMHFNASVFEHLIRSESKYDNILSYYKFDSLVLPRQCIGRSALYLCGIPSQPNEFMSSYLSMYDDLIAITEETKDYWQQYSSSDISVVPSGVDTNRFTPMQTRDTRERLNVTFIGRLIERKGCDQFLRSLNDLPLDIARLLNVQIVGDGPQLNKLKKLSESIDKQIDISYLGTVDTPEMILNDSDICVLPSRRGEGLQGVLLEAMSSGNIVIASDNRTNRQVLDDDRGIIVNPENTQDIGRAILKAIEMIGDNAIISRTQDYIKSNYSWDIVTRQLLERMNQ